MNKILVPYDFSEIATHALNFAADLARNADGCGVTLINVIEQPTPSTFKTMGIVGSDPMENLYIKKLIESVKAKMEEIMGNSDFNDIKLSYKIVLGQPFHEITEEIKTESIDLVVMGTSGSSGAEEFLVGSNAERMVRYSKCPVITISEPKKVADIHSMVFASNFLDLTVEFVNYVKALQAILKAKIHLVVINTPAGFNTTRHDLNLLDKAIKDNMITNCETHIYNYPNEEDGVLAFAEDINADLIAIGTRQKKGVGHFLSGSIAEDVVNHAKVPVWTFGLEQAQ
ncbi:MAG: universal stress protein [Cyclobacteriaceae bacterium]